MHQVLNGPSKRLRKLLVRLGGVFGFLLLAISFFDWLQDSLALG